MGASIHFFLLCGCGCNATLCLVPATRPSWPQWTEPPEFKSKTNPSFCQSLYQVFGHSIENSNGYRHQLPSTQRKLDRGKPSCETIQSRHADSLGNMSYKVTSGLRRVLVSRTEMTFVLPKLLDLKPSEGCALVTYEVAHVEGSSEALQAAPLTGGSIQTFAHLPVKPLW